MINNVVIYYTVTLSIKASHFGLWDSLLQSINQSCMWINCSQEIVFVMIMLVIINFIYFPLEIMPYNHFQYDDVQVKVDARLLIDISF